MSAPVLVCFALEGEAKPFRKLIRDRESFRVLVTGMGQRNTERAIASALTEFKPQHAFTCGIAGALDPALQTGDVVFETRDNSLAEKLAHAGARRGAIACTPRVLITRAEKAALRELTKADAVEMESAFIQTACAELGIPCATVRAISDTANEDLPLDMNLLCDAEQNLSSAKIAFAILRAPHKIPALMRLGSKCNVAAKKLAEVLMAIV